MSATDAKPASPLPGWAELLPGKDFLRDRGTAEVWTKDGVTWHANGYCDGAPLFDGETRRFEGVDGAEEAMRACDDEIARRT